MKLRTLYLLILTLTFTSSCTEEVDVWDSSVKDVSGEWFVRYDHSTYGEDPYGYGFTHIFTYNTAANNGQELWINDNDFTVKYKAKIAVNPVDLSFGSNTAVANTLSTSNQTVKIVNGKILKKVSVQPSGYVADSIYFEVVFSNLDIPGTPDDTLRVGGFRRTGFLEDEH